MHIKFNELIKSEWLRNGQDLTSYIYYKERAKGLELLIRLCSFVNGGKKGWRIVGKQW